MCIFTLHECYPPKSTVEWVMSYMNESRHTWMSHFTHESRHSWVTSHMSHVTHESRHTWVLSYSITTNAIINKDNNDRITRELLAEIYCKMSHGTHERVTSHTHESHVKHESRHVWVTSCMSHVTHESRHTRVTSHTGHVTQHQNKCHSKRGHQRPHHTRVTRRNVL